MRESEIVELLRQVATGGAARGLADDAAVWSPPLGRELVLTHDIVAAGVHYLPGDDPSDIAWKLVAVNLSDLAAKGAVPAGVLLGLSLGDEDEAWLRRFAGGLHRVLSDHGTALWGGDTVRSGGKASLGCTAVGHVLPGSALARAGGCDGDHLYVTGTIGDAGLGLAARRGEAPGDAYLERRYRLPMPRLGFGKRLAESGAHAAMDVSDGLLIDAARMAAASGLAAEIDCKAVPLSQAAAARLPAGDTGRLAAARAGDDYEILLAAPAQAEAALRAAAATDALPLTRIGRLRLGAGLCVLGTEGRAIDPGPLGYEH